MSRLGDRLCARLVDILWTRFLNKTLKNIFQRFDVSLLDNIGKSSEYFIRSATYFPVFYAKCIRWSVNCAAMKIKLLSYTDIALKSHTRTHTIKFIPVCFRIITINWVFFSFQTFASFQSHCFKHQMRFSGWKSKQHKQNCYKSLSHMSACHFVF